MAIFVEHGIKANCCRVSAQAAPDVFSCFVLFANHYLEKSGTTVTRNVSSVAVCLEQCLSVS